MSIYFYACALLSCANAILFFAKEKIQGIMIYLRTILIIFAISNIGYFALAFSTNVQQAIIANKVNYVGGCFMPTLLTLFFCGLCKFEVKKWVKAVLYSYSGIVYLFVLLTGYTDWYYKSVDIVDFYGITALTKEYGFAHIFFYVLLFAGTLSQIVLLVIAVVKRSVPNKYLIILTVLEIVSVFTYFGGRLISPEFEVSPLTFTINGFLMLFLQDDFENVATTEPIQIKREESKVTTGYVIIDRDGRLLGINDVAENYLPSFRECETDSDVRKNPATSFVAPWISECKKAPAAYVIKRVVINNNQYECKMTGMGHDAESGFFLLINDCAEKVKYDNLLNAYKKGISGNAFIKDELNNKVYLNAVSAITRMVEERDNLTGDHIRRTKEAMAIVMDVAKTNKLLKVNNSFYAYMERAALIHDIGKIAVPTEILQKRGEYTAAEYEIVKSHAQRSADIVDQILRGDASDEFVDLAINVAKGHHEKWNGSGYPNGIGGEKIPLEARIMAIVDVYDELVSKRFDRDGLSFEEANTRMHDLMGIYFDPSLQPLFDKSRERLENYYSAK